MTSTSDSAPGLRPASMEVTLDNEEAARIVNLFGKGTLVAQRALHKGYVNWNSSIETSKGRFFLKRRHPALTDPDLIQAKQQFIDHIREHGIPAPAVQRTLQGTGWVAQGGFVYELHEWVSGQSYDADNSAHLSAVGALLARFHLAARSFAPPEALLRHYGWLYGPQVLDQMVGIVERRWPARADWWTALRVQGSTIAEAHAQHAVLTPLVIHGDYYAANIFFNGEQVSALLDYDNAAYQNRVVEVAEALIYFAHQPDKRLNVGVYSGTLNLKKARRFMAAYNAVWSLEPEEQAALPATVQAIWLAVSLRRLDELPAPDADEVLARLQAMQTLSDWAQSNWFDLEEVASARP